MNRKRFYLGCCADRADELLRGIDHLPDDVFDERDGPQLLEIGVSGSTGRPFVVFPHNEPKKRYSLRIPVTATDIFSPHGDGIAFRFNGECYHLFSTTEQGTERGTTAYTLPFAPKEESSKPQ